MIYGGLLSKEFPPILKHKGGVYIISPFSNPDIQDLSRVKVKIGMARKNLYERVDSYHTGLPDSFYTYSIITTMNEDSAFELEKYIHNQLKDYRYKHIEYEARLKGEWFFVRKEKLIKVLNEAIKTKWKIIRGLFNYNDKYFKLLLPPDLLEDRIKNNPPRILYKPANNNRVSGAVRVPKPPRPVPVPRVAKPKPPPKPIIKGVRQSKRIQQKSVPQRPKRQVKFTGTYGKGFPSSNIQF